MRHRYQKLLIAYRLPLILLINLALSALSLISALALRFDGHPFNTFSAVCAWLSCRAKNRMLTERNAFFIMIIMFLLVDGIQFLFLK